MAEPALERVIARHLGTGAAVRLPAAAGDVCPPLRVITLAPGDWAPAKDAPTEPCCVGLRALSEDTTTRAMAMAQQEAKLQLGETPDQQSWVDLANSHVMSNLACQAMTHPEDRNRLWFPVAPEVAIREKMTSGGIQRVYIAYAAMLVEESPLSKVADDDDVAELATLLSAGALARLSDVESRRMRRTLGEVLAKLRGATASS